MDISKRLQTIVNCVPVGTGTIVDIGTDHGYIPISLIKSKRANKCIACDINAMPLANAQKNIRHHKMEEQIETRLSNGLAKIKKGEAHGIIIAGMGGMLIIDILKEKPDLVKAVGLLILQAQLDIIDLRKYLHTIEFTIVDEEMVYEDGKYYTVIIAKPGKENSYTESEYMFGKKTIEKKEVVFKEFLHHKINELNRLEATISKVQTIQAKKRLKEIKEEQDMFKEVFECL